jgi:hypothetical protein
VSPHRCLDKYLLPKLRRVTAAEVTPARIIRVLGGVRHRTRIVANDLLRFARGILSFGVRRQVLPINPVAEFSPRLDAGGPEKSRSRALSHGELIKLFEIIRDTESFGGDNLLAIKLLLALCVRNSELLDSCWLSLIFKVTSASARSGICRPRAPRPAKDWVFHWCRRSLSGFRP